MPTKGERTKQLIKAAAIQLFSLKGYAGVTMKDICEECELSRGGLYRYYGSTKAIMLDILTEDKNEMKELLKQAMQKEIPATQLLNCFLDMIRADIQNEKNRFYFVIHEFAFAEAEQQKYMQRRFESAIEILSMLLDYGKKTGEFKEFDTDTVATHIVFFRDSLTTSSASLQLSNHLIDRQLNLIQDMVIKNEAK